MRQSPTSFAIKYGLFKLDFPDYHAILGVPIGTEPDRVRKKYLKIAYLLHPDTCKAEMEVEKEQASQLLSKLVNPAYENLYKKNLRVEYELILSQMGRRIAMEGEISKITLISEEAKELYQAGVKLELVYRQLLQELTKNQYQSLHEAIGKIGKISELNLVYLSLSQTEAPEERSPIKKPDSKPSDTELKTQPTTGDPVQSYIRRAREYIEGKNYTNAIMELRDALQLEPNNSTGHALMGLAYLYDKKLGMAKVHINKAWSLNAKDPLVLKSKQELDKHAASGGNSKNSGNIFKWKLW